MTKLMKLKYVAIFLVLLCCFMGAASAADDVSIDAVDASVDDAVIADAVSEDISDSTSVEETQVETVDDVTTESTVPNEITTEETSDETKVVEEEINEEDTGSNRGIPVSANNWVLLKYYSESTSDYTITLTGNSFTIGDAISFQNSATIIGSTNSYITGGTTSKTPFLNTNSALTLHFINVKFKNINAKNLLELDGTVYLENCSFDNIQTATGHNSVIYNTNNYMYLTGCNITNSNTGYGAVSNYNSGSTTSVVMYVDDCKFINNTASSEPGAINNCGILYVNNSEFINNHANLWAGAIHTHINAQSYLANSKFINNTAGWNGGALYTYSLLCIYNCTFDGNNCTTNNGGGAIGAYNYGSTYNITVSSSRFNYNTNLCYAYTNISTTSVGRGGAISVLNGGYLTVCDSNFTGNYAKIGQAIAAATYTYENGTGGNPHIKICNNRFENHTATGIDTVVITGNDYIFNNNVFVNSYQNTQYAGNGNVYSTSPVPSSSSIKSRLGSSKSDIVGIDFEGQDIIYVNSSSENSFIEVDGLRWETAVGTPDALALAVNFINNDGTIYIADGNYNRALFSGVKNITLIGQGKNTIINVSSTVYGSENDKSCKYTFINLTFNDLDSCRDADFINCTFINPISVAKDFTNYDEAHIDEYGYAKTYFMNFDNCEFNDFNDVSSLITLYKYGQAKFTNCTFDNIVADSIVGKNGDFIDQDGIYLYDCKFTNCNIKGVVDIPGNIEILDFCAIENCDYDFDATTNVVSDDEHAHNYLNATKLAKPDTTLVADVDDAGNLLVSLTAGGNAVANGKVLISVNGAEAVSYDLGEDGTLSIALSDLTDATGKLNIAVTFEETDDYKGSSGSASAVLVVKTFTEKIDPVDTAITASDITATAKIAKTLSITLKDANGNALANKAVKVTVNGKTSTVTTDDNGVAKVTVNYAKAGTYYYTFTYLGDNDYKASLKPVKVTVNKQATKATFAKKTFKVKATKKISFTLKDSKGKAIAKKKITFKVNGKTYTAKTNSKGVATVKIVIKKKGKYTATAKFAGDTTYKAISKKATITIR